MAAYHMRFPTYPTCVAKAIETSCDPFKLATIALAISTIERENIPGGIAECGVWRGNLSVFLRLNSPKRKLYLFDTFQGFAERDLEGSFDDRFRDTSLECVMSRVPDAIPRVGYFPDTTRGLQ
jgi:O-methyltransferase